MASQGAKIVVNDLGANTDGTGSGMIADEVVEEIKAAGGEAVSNTDSVADVASGERLIKPPLMPLAAWISWSTMQAFCAIAPFSKWKNPIGMQCLPCT